MSGAGRNQDFVSPETRVKDSCDLPCGSWEPSPGSLEEQQVKCSYTPSPLSSPRLPFHSCLLVFLHCVRVHAYVHMCAHMQGHTWMSEDNLGVHSLLPLCGSRRLNSHPQAWWPAPPHAEPPHHRPPISVLHKYFISLRGKYKSLLSSHSILPWHLQLYCREAFRIKMNSVSFLG